MLRQVHMHRRKGEHMHSIGSIKIEPYRTIQTEMIEFNNLITEPIEIYKYNRTESNQIKSIRSVILVSMLLL